MSFNGVLTPEQLSILKQAFEERCLALGILTAEGREAAATQLMNEFREGSAGFDGRVLHLADTVPPTTDSRSNSSQVRQ